MSEPVTITIEGDLFRAAKQAFEDRCELELNLHAHKAGKPVAGVEVTRQNAGFNNP